MLTMEFERAKGSERRVTCHRKLDINPIDVAYSSSHEDHEDRHIKRRWPFRDDLSDLKIQAPEFDRKPQTEKLH